MTYVKQTWINDEIGGTPISAARLNYIENGIEVAGPWTDVRKYGVTGTGLNESSGLQAAHDALPATGGTLWLPPGTYMGGITVTKNLSIRGDNRRTTTLQAPPSGEMFNLSGAFATGGQARFSVSELSLVGNGAGSQVMNTESGVTFAEGSISYKSCRVADFPATALVFGTSIYFWLLDDVYFLRCAGSVDARKFADGIIRNCWFVSAQSAPSVKAIGPTIHVTDSWFYGGDALTGTEPDIVFTTLDGLESGHSRITGNKFGPEGEVAGRVKIQVTAPTATWVIPGLTINHNKFFGVVGQTAIRINNPVLAMDISNNEFENFDTIVNDIQGVTLSTHGDGTFINNKVTEVISSNTAGVRLFTNGGRDFTTIVHPGAKERSIARDSSFREAPELRNRIIHSETYTDASWTKAGVAITAAQTDPFDTTRASLLTKAGLVGSEHLAQVLVNTAGMMDATGAAASGNNGRAFLSFWAKAGTLDTLLAGWHDFPLGGFVALERVQLSAKWRRYTIPINGINPAVGATIYFYPGSTSLQAGTVYLFGVQISDYDSDYLPTTTVVRSDTTAGTRFNRTVHIDKTNATDLGLSIGRAADTVARCSIRGDGTISHGPGSGAVDATIRRSGVGFYAMPFLVKAGVPSDADYDIAPPNGTMAWNSATTPPTPYVRIAGAWVAGPSS